MVTWLCGEEVPLNIHDVGLVVGDLSMLASGSIQIVEVSNVRGAEIISAVAHRAGRLMWRILSQMVHRAAHDVGRPDLAASILARCGSPRNGKEIAEAFMCLGDLVDSDDRLFTLAQAGMERLVELGHLNIRLLDHLRVFLRKAAQTGTVTTEGDRMVSGGAVVDLGEWDRRVDALGAYTDEIVREVAVTALPDDLAS